MARSERKPAPRKAAASDEGNRRAELIRAAGRLFVDKGFDATTIRDIADAVGMRSGSPFYHFKSKQEMLKAVMIEGLQAALDAQDRKSTRLNSSHSQISYAVFCLKK